LSFQSTIKLFISVVWNFYPCHNVSSNDSIRVPRFLPGQVKLRERYTWQCNIIWNTRFYKERECMLRTKLICFSW
jgi:hypothetical protein